MPLGKKQPAEERFWLYVEKCEGGCWEWRGHLNKKGYGKIGKDGKNMGSHRLSYELHHPLTNPMNDIKLFVLHSCDNPKCVNPSHLSLGTQQDNMTDMTNKGRRLGVTQGEKHHQSKLTEQQVIEIRTRYTGIRGQQQQLATEYGVSRKTISNIISRKNWAYLQ